MIGPSANVGDGNVRAPNPPSRSGGPRGDSPDSSPKRGPPKPDAAIGLAVPGTDIASSARPSLALIPTTSSRVSGTTPDRFGARLVGSGPGRLPARPRLRARLHDPQPRLGQGAPDRTQPISPRGGHFLSSQPDLLSSAGPGQTLTRRAPTPPSGRSQRSAGADRGALAAGSKSLRSDEKRACGLASSH